MENKSTGSKVAIVGSIITATAGIITAIVSITGPLLDKRMAIEATQTREAIVLSATKVAGAAIQKSDTPTPEIPATEVAEPTLTTPPTFPTATVTLAPASAADNSSGGSEGGNSQPQASNTPSETMLRVGESWTIGNGISVQLTEIKFPAVNEVHLVYNFTNQSQKVMKITLDHNRDVILTDDKGNVYTWATTFTWEVSIYPGTTRKDVIKRRGDVSKASYFIVKLNIPEMGSAQWKQ